MARPALMTMPTLPEGRVGTWTSVALVERVATRARALRVGVVDGEPLRVDPVGEVDGGAGQVGRAHPVDHDLHRAVLGGELVDDVAVERALVEEQLIAQAGTAAGLDGDPQPQVVAAF